MKTCEKECCRNCCFYEHPNTNTGWGECHDTKGGSYSRPNGMCYRYVSIEQARQHIRTLEVHNKWRRDDNVPNAYPMQDPTEIGKAIDFAVEYIKSFINLNL